MVTHIPQMVGRAAPLLVFHDFIDDPDPEVMRHIQRQLSHRKDWLTQLKKKIGFEKRVKLSVEQLRVRLMFVPQLEKNHSAAYHRYCRDITDYVFEMNRMDNFYETITCPQVSYPPLPKTGIAAFLVHRLAKQYEAVCRFTAESGRSVKFKANGAIFSNHLGAVDLEIEMLEPGRYGLKRKPFTIWQNDTKNLYTLMSVPVEETLHYYLGTATDREIAAEMEENPPENLSTARRLAEEWMAVEESVVGGLVKGVLKRYGVRYNMKIPDLNSREQASALSLHQYRYRAQGIRLVGDLGFEDALGLYMDSPSDFRDRLFHKKMHNSGITVSQRTDSVPYRKLVSPP
ncbi:MAG: hypothetical protein HGJ94_18670 [Desulfosarcina sp.]|nr:hypothetical protein [Desulfosarcina sp.]